jgi:hypothetical protein
VPPLVARPSGAGGLGAGGSSSRPTGPFTDALNESWRSVFRLHAIQQLGQSQPECLRERGRAAQAWLRLARLNPGDVALVQTRC